MKKVLIITLLLFKILPFFDKGTFSIILPGSLFAQDYGSKGYKYIICSCGGITYNIPSDQDSTTVCPDCPGEVPVSPGLCPFCGQYPCVCGLSSDPCDSTSVNYNECLCHGNTCYPETCDPTSPLFDECLCLGINCIPGDNTVENDCLCLTNLTLTPVGGVLRNNAGEIIYLINHMLNGRLGYPAIYSFTYGDATAWTTDGSPVSLMHLEGLKIDGVETDFQSYGYNCLGWVLTEGKFIVSTDLTAEINKALGISSVGEAIRSRIIKMSETCEGILPGQVVLLFDETNHYKHAAIYEGKGIYSTKNGLGLGEGVQYWTLKQIQDLYYDSSSGAVKTGYINAPRKINNTSSLGKYSGGLITAEDFSGAISNCECIQPK